METLVEQEEYFFFSKEIFMLMVDFGESGVRDARITMVVCRAGSATGDRMARSTPEDSSGLDSSLKVAFCSGRVRNAGLFSACICLALKPLEVLVGP